MHWGFDDHVVVAIILCLPFLWLARLIIGSLFGDGVVAFLVACTFIGIGIEAKSYLYWLLLAAPFLIFIWLWRLATPRVKKSKREAEALDQYIARALAERELHPAEKAGKARWYNEPMSK